MPLTDSEMIRRLLLAAAIGGLIGAERELRHKPAGFRTNILIAMGAAVFTMLSASLAEGSDPTRISAQLVTGIGFLGAGAIIRTRDGVHGLTTAATVWVNAALGMAAGGGAYHMALMGGGVTLIVLLILGPIEAAVEGRTARARSSASGEPSHRNHHSPVD
jgi:putative Mg2+ transporter-C (MgtC) family protein